MASSRGLPAAMEAPPTPDSTSEKYRSGDDVLLEQKDGRFYLGTVVQVDAVREQCLVKFGDNTDIWSPYSLLAKFNVSEEDLLMCFACKKRGPKTDVIECYTCGRGYHYKCHQPPIATENIKEDSVWNCQRCEPVKNKIELKQQPPLTPPAETPKVLPYDLNSLTWDTYHRVNKEHTYCYCGFPGEWDKQMIQCTRCKQWFHGRCVNTLKYPLYCGDRFYVFVCAICNQGKEFVRRLEMKWVDLVHLILFNLTSFNSRKYYDLDKIVIPYMNDNWQALQLPPKIINIARCDRRDNILSVLTNNRNRFKCGREIKKRTTIWGLRVFLPPPAPNMNLPLSGRITEDDLRELWQGNRRLQFIPPTPGRGIPEDNHMLGLMMGVTYMQSAGNMSETDSPCPSPEPMPRQQSVSVYGAGAVKKTTPNVPMRNKKRLVGARRRHTNEADVKNEMPPTPPTSVSAPATPPTVQAVNNDKSETQADASSGDETSSKSTLDLIIPPPKDFEGKNNPFLGLLRTNGGKRAKDGAASITLPLPLTAVIPGKPVMRPTKRKLSEKDIFIGPNGEVKRRRFRRNLRGNYGTQTASKTATVLPARPDTKEWEPNSSGECINGRRLRQRTVEKTNTNDKEKQQQQQQPQQQQSVTSSPVKQEPNMDDLKSSVNIYFGAANRIAAGEKFTVKAQRIGPMGKLEFLIEWEGLT